MKWDKKNHFKFRWKTHIRLHTVEDLRCWLLSFSCICDLLHKTISMCMSNVSFRQNKVDASMCIRLWWMNTRANGSIPEKNISRYSIPPLVAWLVGRSVFPLLSFFGSSFYNCRCNGFGCFCSSLYSSAFFSLWFIFFCLFVHFVHLL